MTVTPPPAAPVGTHAGRRSTSAAPTLSTLRWLYLLRGVAAVAWAIAFAATSDSLGTGARSLLVLYPLIDVVATLVDAGGSHSGQERRILWVNAALSVSATVGLAVAGSHGIAATLHVFGVWATVSGVAQVTVALRRRGPRAGGQWPMLVAGLLSTLVGVFYNLDATGSHPTLSKLVAYAAAGGVFFLAQSAILAWRSRPAGPRN